LHETDSIESFKSVLEWFGDRLARVAIALRLCGCV
jgi:hypothetical protein